VTRRVGPLLAGTVAAVLALGACDATAEGSASSSPQHGQAAPQRTTSSEVVRPKYVELAQAVTDKGGRVWVESDLVKAWRSGPAAYADALAIVTSLADRDGVEGVKVADELGYDDGLDLASARKFLAQVTGDLRSRLPSRKLMVDMIVPELGCLAWRDASPDKGKKDCAASEDRKNPAATISALDGYVQAGWLDVLNLSAGLRTPVEYAMWGTSRDDAMTAIWTEAQRRWSGRVVLQARKALAHPGRYDGSAQDAEADVHTYVDIPVAHGAKAVDIWTWSQPYKGGTYQLTDPGLGSNALMAALDARRAKGVQLWTHMTPSSLQRGLDQDVSAAVRTFGTILVASGTG